MVLMCPVLGVFHPVASIKSSGVGPELVNIHHAWLSAHFSTTNSTGAKPYSRPSTLLSTGAYVPVAPVESAPMLNALANAPTLLILCI